jgi:hypothetical protein
VLTRLLRLLLHCSCSAAVKLLPWVEQPRRCPSPPNLQSAACQPAALGLGPPACTASPLPAHPLPPPTLRCRHRLPACLLQGGYEGGSFVKRFSAWLNATFPHPEGHRVINHGLPAVTSALFAACYDKVPEVGVYGAGRLGSVFTWLCLSIFLH